MKQEIISCIHRVKGTCDCLDTSIPHCIDCCRAACGSSGPGSNDWNWKKLAAGPVPKKSPTSPWNVDAGSAGLEKKPITPREQGLPPSRPGRDNTSGEGVSSGPLPTDLAIEVWEEGKRID